MGRLPKLFIVCCILFFSATVGYSSEFENTADNPRLINLAPEQFRALDMVEKRVFGNTFAWKNTLDRIENLELQLFQSIQHGTPTQRINALRLESTKTALRGTSMTPMMESNFNSRYINPRSEGNYYDDVGLIDGLIKVWWPDFYAKLSEYRRYKEANFF